MIKYSVTGLPDGITYDPETHSLRGYTAVPGVYRFVVQAFDSATGVSSPPVEMTLTITEATAISTPLSLLRVYSQETIQDLRDRTLALQLDITGMRIYKQEATIEITFQDVDRGEQVVQPKTSIFTGKFSVQKEGGRTYIYIAPESIRAMFEQVRTEARGVWNIKIDSTLEPLKHRTVFPHDNISATDVEQEFLRLDIQDQTKLLDNKEHPFRPTTNSVRPRHMKARSVQERHIFNGAVTFRNFATSSVRERHIQDGSVTRNKLGVLVDESIKQGAVTTDKLAGSIAAGKLADPATRLPSPVHGTGNLDEEAVTTAKLVDKAVTKDKLHADAIVTSKLQPASVRSEHISRGTLNAGHLEGNRLARTINPSEVTNTHLADKTVSRTKLDWLGLAKYMRSQMAVFDRPVLNPDQIPPGTPVGLHIKPGDTKPTAYRLNTPVEYIPASVAEDPRDVSVYGTFTPQTSDADRQAVQNIRIRALKIKDSSNDDVTVTDPVNGVWCLNRRRLGDGSWLVAYFARGAFYHSTSKIFIPGATREPSAENSLTNDNTSPVTRLNIIVERRTKVDDPTTTTEFYMNTVLNDADLDLTSDQLTQYSRIDIEVLAGRENRGGIYVGAHASIADPLNTFKTKGSWLAPESSGAMNDLPYVRTQLYNFTIRNTRLANNNASATAYKQAVIDAPKLNNAEQQRITESDKDIGDTRGQLVTEWAQGAHRLPGLGFSLYAEDEADVASRKAIATTPRPFKATPDEATIPDTQLVHFVVPSQVYTSRSTLRDGTQINFTNAQFFHWAFGKKDTNDSFKWAVLGDKWYTDGSETTGFYASIAGLPRSVDARAGVNFIQRTGTSQTGLTALCTDGFMHLSNINTGNEVAYGGLYPGWGSDWLTRAHRAISPDFLKLHRNMASRLLFVPTAQNIYKQNTGFQQLQWLASLEYDRLAQEIRLQQYYTAVTERTDNRGMRKKGSPIVKATDVAAGQVSMHSVYSNSARFRYSYIKSIDRTNEEVTVFNEVVNE